MGPGEGSVASSATPTFSITDIAAADLDEDDMDSDAYEDSLNDRSKVPSAERRTAFDTAPLHAAIAAIETDARTVLDRKTAYVVEDRRFVFDSLRALGWERFSICSGIFYRTWNF